MWWGKTQPAAFWHHSEDFRGNWKPDFLLVFHFCLSCWGAPQEIATDLKDALQQCHADIVHSNKQQIQRITFFLSFLTTLGLFFTDTHRTSMKLHPLKFHHNATELHLLQNVSINTGSCNAERCFYSTDNRRVFPSTNLFKDFFSTKISVLLCCCSHEFKKTT